ncbi:putative glycoside hydrolase [Acidipropionibacterium virtanenii]|uniref:Glycoside-hydrolase family GH114 TIM-barrel domain-containing protein n=1 Tax=Acidipropionibacterium virtanenii TaxID=2057246 RepID=A0A344USU2_9ACTN|nr:putative glycoside hydrolase [Acidipropionibacterium virtanenii]AXE38340.1 hypothetical protein JS278_01160 [Acidipropionibacterium virtanenii]
MAPSLAWIRYAGPLERNEVERAAGRFRAVILQPWEEDAARRLKDADPGVTVLAYQCLSSVRIYEPGPRYTSGVSPQVADRAGTCAMRNGELIEWEGYPGHYQQKVWDPVYRSLWVSNVVSWMSGSAFDGVMADNDVFDDYYGHGIDPMVLREGLDQLVDDAGAALAGIGKLLVPNIAEARREPGRWGRHSRFGGGLEECFLGWGTGPDEWLDLADCLAQLPELTAPGLTITRVPGSGTPGDPGLTLALAAAWVFAPEADVAVTATSHDGYSAMPLIETPDLGAPELPWLQPAPGCFSRRLTKGTAMVNLSATEATFDGVTLGPRTGYLHMAVS